MVTGFEIGDTVKLKSGSPVMTVKSTKPDSCECEWFVSDSLLKCESFNPKMLIKTSEIKSKSIIDISEISPSLY